MINVTINETVDGRSQVQQQDSKGVGMALGPAGISAGIRHHLIFDSTSGRSREGAAAAKVYPGSTRERADAPPFLVLAYSGDLYQGESLSLGRWVGIFGAAFSTGLGSRTSLGLSLLAGMGNVRLGYWWNSGIDKQLRPVGATTRRAAKMLIGALKWLFRVQTYFLYEFLARFRGTADRHWFLSDGGHFENMGAYELIRRRLPVIVLIDAEQDVDYTFERLASLVRKARLDFRAELEFLTVEQLGDALDARLRPFFGPIDHLRRGRWNQEPVRDPNDPRWMRLRKTVEDTAEHRCSLAHAALARIRYDGSDQSGSWLLYVKPTLIGDKPPDVLQYHSAHPAFPQETTADQFFDEAQWESYRRLGDHIGTTLFQGIPEGEPGRFVSHLFGFR